MLGANAADVDIPFIFNGIPYAPANAPMPLLSSVKFAPGRKQEFLAWIQHELKNTIGDRSELERKWENAIIQWRAQLPDGELDFPFVGASNLELPLTAMHSDPVFADMIQTLHAPEDYWTPEARRGDRVDHASPLREAVSALERRYIHMRRVNLKAILDNNIHGTAFYKNNWKSERRAKRVYLPDGTSVRETEFISQPAIEHVPIQRLYFPADAWSLDFNAQGGTRWVAQEFFVTEGQFKLWSEGSDELPGFDKEGLKRVQTFLEDEIPPVDRTVQEENEYKPFEFKRIRLFEVWVRFAPGADGVEEDFVALVHYESGELLRAIYNPNAHGQHPFYATNYLPGPGVYGIGISEIDEWAQEAGTKLLNAQIDNALLANTRMFSVPLGSNVQPGEPIYPGKTWYLGPDEKVSEIRLSEVYPSIFNSLTQLVQFADLRTGVPDMRQGDIASLPSRTPAQSLQAIMHEGNKRFDMILANIRDVHSDMGLRMIQNVAQRVQERPEKWANFFIGELGERDAQMALEVLLSGSIEDSFGIAVTATSAMANKEKDKQDYLAMLQTTGQIYAQLIQTVMLMAQVQDPLVQATASAAYASGVELLVRLFESFDVQNPKKHLGQLEQVVEQMQGGGQQQGMGGAQIQQLLGILGGAGGIPPQMIPGGQVGSVAGF